ncbi:MAG: serine hydrolase domain-containing protein [Bacteroidota bacterium]
MKHILFILLVAYSTLSFAQEKVVFINDIDSLIKQYLLDKDFPSAAVGVVYSDQVLYEKRIEREKESEASTDEKSIYNIASVAKPFVATAIMILVQEGKIDIKSPVVQYLPYFKMASKYQDDITIEHLLTHTSGLPGTSSPDDYDYLDVDTTDSALINHIKSLSELKLKFKPGKKYAYSNVGFEILGQIIAEVSGMSFDEFMNAKLFQPLQMNRTSYILSNFQATDISQPHLGHPNQKTNRFPYNRAFSPSGNLFTPIEDINKWMIFNLNAGKWNGFKPLSSENFNELITPRVENDDDGFVGLGWMIEKNLIVHDGLDMGYSALMVLFKKQKIGITVLINHQEADCNELLNLIAKSIKW